LDDANEPPRVRGAHRLAAEILFWKPVAYVRNGSKAAITEIERPFVGSSTLGGRLTILSRTDVPIR
jgi:hypothetical protein